MLRTGLISDTSPLGRSLLQHTQTQYLWSSNSTYAAPNVNLLSLPYNRWIFDGVGTQAAYTVWRYDETSLQDAPGITGHSSSYGTGQTVRGNDTSEQRFLDTTRGYVVTQRTYDIAGNTVTLKDPVGNTTTYAYNDDGSNHYAFATSVKNALNQTTTAAYDYNIGKPADSYNLNGGHTQYQYNDLLDRLTKIVRPDGGTTNYSYTPIQIDTYRDQNTTGNRALHTEILSDGLGRESETRQYESGSGYIATTRTYSALGQVATTTNPSRPGDGLGVATSYESDGLGRNTLVQTADGSQVISSYAGNAVTVKDPAWHARKTTSDALGRISSVTEDPGGLNYVTNYGYDVTGSQENGFRLTIPIFEPRGAGPSIARLRVDLTTRGACTVSTQ